MPRRLTSHFIPEDPVPAPTFDPVCLRHGKRRSEHLCLYCQLCFEDLKPEDCWEDEDGQKWDVCKRCKAIEEIANHLRGSTYEMDG